MVEPAPDKLFIKLDLIYIIKKFRVNSNGKPFNAEDLGMYISVLQQQQKYSTKYHEKLQFHEHSSNLWMIKNVGFFHTNQPKCALQKGQRNVQLTFANSR